MENISWETIVGFILTIIGTIFTVLSYFKKNQTEKQRQNTISESNISNSTITQKNSKDFHGK